MGSTATAAAVMLASDALPLAGYVCDAAGVITQWNRRAVELWGREPEPRDRFGCGHLCRERGGQRLADAEHPVAAAIAGREPAPQALLLERADGTAAWIEIEAAPTREGGAVALVRDVSARRQAEEAMRDQLALATDFLENGVVGLHWVGPDGTILWANQAELGLLGYAPEEYVGHHIREFHADEPVICDILDRLGRNQSLESYEARLRCRDGGIRHVLISSNVLWRDGRFVHTRCFTRDITPRKRAEEALRRSEERYRDLAENLPQLIWSTDAEGKFVFANRRWTEETGLDLEASRRTDWREIVHPDDHGRVMGTWAEAFAAGRPYEVEFRLRRARDGGFRWYLIRAWPHRDEHGRIENWHGSSTDIHELKSAQLAAADAQTRLREHEEHLRRQADDLLRSNAELEQFAYIAAHDLQEPTRMIASYLQLIERRAGAQLDAKTREHFEFVVAAARRMREMIRSILEYSRIGKEGVQATSISSAAACALALEALDERIARSGGRVEVAPLPQVHGVAPQVVRLFQNLISNALKFRGDQPPVVRVRAERSGAEWVFAVADNGIGIRPDDGKRLFGLFQRLHGTDKYPGTGIGLASCKKIVEAHHGRIWFEPATGGGTAFKFTLPATRDDS